MLSWGLIVLDQTIFPGSGMTEVAGLSIIGAHQHLAMTPLVVVIVGAQIVVAYGLLVGRGWGRPFAVLYWPVAGVTLTVMQFLGGVSGWRTAPYLFEALCMGAIAWCYLYRSSDTRRYYEERAAVDRPSTP